MENKKLVIALSILVAIFGLGFVGALIYSMGLKNGQQAGPTGGGDPQNAFPGAYSESNGSGGAAEPMYVAEKEKQPEVMTGQIESVEGEKMVLKQIASIDLRYEIKKEDVGEIIKMEKNPSFDAEKAKKAQEEFMKMLPQPKTPSPDQISNNNEGEATPPELSEAAKKKLEELRSDPEINMYKEIKGSWSDLKSEMQINLITEKNGKRKITIFSEDFPMGQVPGSTPPPSPSPTPTPAQ